MGTTSFSDRQQLVARCQAIGPGAHLEGAEMRTDRGQRAAIKNIAQLEANRDVMGLFKAWSYGGKGDFVIPAMNALARLGKVTIEPLVRALEDKDEKIRGTRRSSLDRSLRQ